MSQHADIGPWGRRRDLHFAREHQRDILRRVAARRELARARTELRALDDQRRSVERALRSAEFGSERWHRLVTEHEHLGAEQTRLRHEVDRRRRAAQPAHAEILNEWAVQYDQLPAPAPGQLLLSRASKKPYRDR